MTDGLMSRTDGRGLRKVIVTIGLLDLSMQELPVSVPARTEAWLWQWV